MSSTTAGDRPWSLAARLTTWYAISAFALVAAASIFLYWAMVSGLDREDVQTLREPVQAIRSLLRKGPSDPTAVRDSVEWVWATRPVSQVHVRLLDTHGAIVAETPGMTDLLPPTAFPSPVAENADPPDHLEVRPHERTFRVAAATAAAGPAGDTHFIVQAALDRTPEEQLLAEFRRDLAMVLAAALALCAIGGYWIARRGVRPLAEVTAAAARVRPSTLNQRIDAAGLPAELHALARTFNNMMGRLEDSFGRLARFSADIAHELRTPVNNLRGGVEVALGKPRTDDEYREVLGSALEDCDRLTRMINDLLFLARTENPATEIHRESVDVQMELRAVREFYDAAAAEAGVQLVVAEDQPITTCLDRGLLQRAVGNLLTNALAHTPAGGVVTLSTAATDDGVDIRVSDTGRGVTPEHLPFLFDRFYRADPSRRTAPVNGNVGLGLAIVKGIVELHGGRVGVQSNVGSGTQFTLHFPKG